MSHFISPTKSRFIDTLFKYLIYFLSCIALIPLFMIIFFVLAKGLTYFNLEFFFNDAPRPVSDVEFISLNSFNIQKAVGGIRNSFIGMLLIVSLASFFAIPLGILIAIYLSENKTSKFSYCTLLCVEGLQGIPSIIFGILANIWIVLTFKSYSGVAGSFALGIMMLPIIIKSSYETLLMIPSSLKETALALGVPYGRVLIKVVLPSSAGGIFSGILLGVSRVLGETAPLLFTAFGNPYFTTNIFGPMETIAMQISKNATAPNINLIENAWGASLALVLIILLLNLIVKPMIDKIKIKF
ncbi:MAG: phosphate ABC transporter permease PstA [Brevinema sp.]